MQTQEAITTFLFDFWQWSNSENILPFLSLISTWFLLFSFNMSVIYCYMLMVETPVGDIQD